jgi:hypothetical protein
MRDDSQEYLEEKPNLKDFGFVITFLGFIAQKLRDFMNHYCTIDLP